MIYWLSGFADNAGRYFFLLLLLYLSSLTMSAIYRTVSFMTANQFIAQQLDSPITVISLLFGGFLITYDKIPRWLIWLYWLSPFSWGLRALSINEFYDSKYSAPAPQDSQDTLGIYYMSQFDIPSEWPYKWSAIGFYVFYFILFSFCKLSLLSTLYASNSVWARSVFVMKMKSVCYKSSKNKLLRRQGHSCFARYLTVQPAAPSPTAAYSSVPWQLLRRVVLRARLDVPRPQIGKSLGSSGYSARSSLPFEPMNLVWKNVKYTIVDKNQKPPKTRVLLNEINGFVEPGVLTALMGSSGNGAGKTTSNGSDRRS